MHLKKTALTSAIALTLGATSMMASAATSEITLNWSGFLTMANSSGSALQNPDFAITETVYSGYRTPISGTMTFCSYLGGTHTTCGSLNAGDASLTVNTFSFLGSGDFVTTQFSMQAIPSTTLMLGNLTFNWNGTTGIPTSIVLDADGFLGAVAGGLQTSDTVSGTGVYAASENTKMAGTAAKPTLMPLGLLPIATTTWNTTDVGTIALGSYPSGTLPLIADTVTDAASCNLVGTSCGATLDTGIGGSPMKAGPFPQYNINFDITNMHVTNDTQVADAVPVPAAAWLFGSGLLGLIGVARRRKS